MYVTCMNIRVGAGEERRERWPHRGDAARHAERALPGDRSGAPNPRARAP